jgi:hypothetical protein
MNPLTRTGIVALALRGMLIAAWGGERTNTFQLDLDGYAGVRDTFVSSLAWANPPQYAVNYGVSELLVVSRTGSDNPLLRFDLSADQPGWARANGQPDA